jgi:hypothetical protein
LVITTSEHIYCTTIATEKVVPRDVPFRRDFQEESDKRWLPQYCPVKLPEHQMMIGAFLEIKPVECGHSLGCVHPVADKDFLLSPPRRKPGPRPLTLC